MNKKLVELEFHRQTTNQTRGTNIASSNRWRPMSFKARLELLKGCMYQWWSRRRDFKVLNSKLKLRNVIDDVWWLLENFDRFIKYRLFRRITTKCIPKPIFPPSSSWVAKEKSGNKATQNKSPARNSPSLSDPNEQLKSIPRNFISTILFDLWSHYHILFSFLRWHVREFLEIGGNEISRCVKFHHVNK